MEQLVAQTNRLLTETCELNTILDYIRWGASRFNAEKLYFGHGTNNSIDEAAALVLYALNLDDNVADCYLQSNLTNTEREAIITLLMQRIKERKPAAYITNQASFCGLSFYVDERTLVPRSPIAELIENTFSPWCDQESITSILDIGTGSGCIAIASAYHFPYAVVTAVDRSEDALAVARINVDKHELENRVHLIHSDLFSELGSNKYDLIISNPPYVSDREWRSLPAEYLSEPKLGFHGGESGLDIVQRILSQAKNHLTEQGVLVIEVGRSAEKLLEMYPDVEFLWLDFEHGGDGVFLLTAEQLIECNAYFRTDQKQN